MAIFYDGLDDINLTSGRHVSIPDPRFFTLSVHQTAKTIPQPQYFKHKPLGVISFFFPPFSCKRNCLAHKSFLVGKGKILFQIQKENL